MLYGKDKDRWQPKKFACLLVKKALFGFVLAGVSVGLHADYSFADKPELVADQQISTLAGTGQICNVFPDTCGDSGLATAARLNTPIKVVSTTNEDEYFIVDSGANRIRKVDREGVITTVAGTGQACAIPINPCGDGALATAAQLNNPQGVAVGPGNEIYIADSGDNRIRRVGSDGKITTVAGDGNPGFGGDGFAATSAQLNAPADVAVRGSSSLLIADSANNRIRRVTFAGGIIQTVAGSGVACLSANNACGDGALATFAQLKNPTSVALLPGDGFIFVEPDISRVRTVPADGGGVVSRIAGVLGPSGFSGDGGPAVNAQLNAPHGVFVTPSKEILVADTENNRIRSISPSGEIATILGSNMCPAATDPCGDGTSAGNALLAKPTSAVALTKDHAVVISDRDNRRVRITKEKTKGPQPKVDPPSRGPETPRAPQEPAFFGLVAVGKTVGVEPVGSKSGVIVRTPGQSTFRPLGGQEVLPNGTEVDVTKASAVMTIRTPEEGVHVQQARVSGSRFIVRQRGNDQDGVADFILSTPIQGCPKVPKDPAANSLRLVTSAASQGVKQSQRKRPNAQIRRLWVQTKGRRVRTRGKGAVGAVRGTRWATVDDCRKRINRRLKQEQTRVVVVEGIVAARDFARHKTFLVTAGNRHVAYLRKKSSRRKR